MNEQIIIPEGSKPCSKCRIVKPLEQFNMATKTRRRADCKDCRKQRNAKYYDKSKDVLKKKREDKKTTEKNKVLLLKEISECCN